MRSTTLHDAFHIAGVGASTGGVPAFPRLLGHIKEDAPLAAVAAQHLDPTRAPVIPPNASVVSAGTSR
jgi:chemotaxis response regulator CheB